MKKAKQYVYLNLVFGIIWLMAGFFKVGVRGLNNWLGYIWFALAAFYIGTFVYQISRFHKKKPEDTDKN
jgi:hypothetical protein